MKLLGSFLVYVFIILYQFVINKINIFHFIYFYYVGFVMAMTYVARIKGEFVGAPTELFYFIGLGLVSFSFFIFGYYIFRNRKYI